MPTVPTTDEILSKYKEVYPDAEALVAGQNLFYRRGLDDLERMYKEWNIPGADRARYIAQYVMSVTTAIVTNSQQMALALLNAAYTLPYDTAVKEAQKLNVEKDTEVKTGQLTNLEKDIEVKESQIAKILKDIEYEAVQTRVLEESNTLNALIKVFQSLSDMMGSMGSGGIVAPPFMVAANGMAALKAMAILKDGGTKLFNRTVTVPDPNNPDTNISGAEYEIFERLIEYMFKQATKKNDTDSKSNASAEMTPARNNIEKG